MGILIENYKLIENYIKANWRRSFNEPSGILKYKFIDPAADYRGQLWDWDSFFCGLALIDVYDDTVDYIKGCVMNFIDNQASDGYIPYMINVGHKKDFSYALPAVDRKPRSPDSDLNSIKPILAQMAMLTYRKEKNSKWLEEIYNALQKHIKHWEQTQKTKNGLFVWRSYRGSGTDNHPGVYGRPLNSSAAVELNCIMYAEYIDMALIASICGDSDNAINYKKTAEKLAEDINIHMWDEIDGLYYNLDMMSQKPSLANQEITWDLPLKFRSWTCFMPLWAGIAPLEYAKRMIDEHITNDDEFWSDYGIRTLAKNERAYSTLETSNPSNWQGPIWIVSTYLIFKGLINYGCYDIADKIAENLINNLARDIKKNGVLHEYYNPETGQSSINPGFMNWNALAGLMLSKY